MDPQTPTPQTPTTAAGALSEQEVGWFRSLMNRVSGTPAEPTTPPATTAPATTATDPPQITDADLQALIASVEPTAEPAEPGVEPTGEPVAASLSAEDRQTLDLANQRAERAEVRAGTTTISARLDGYIAAGVPPAVVDPIRAHLIGDTAEQKSLAIDFANGREPVVAKALFATLDAAKGTIDFSEKGSEMARIDSEDDKVKQMQKESDELASRYV